MATSFCCIGCWSGWWWEGVCAGGAGRRAASFASEGIACGDGCRTSRGGGGGGGKSSDEEQENASYFKAMLWKYDQQQKILWSTNSIEVLNICSSARRNRKTKGKTFVCSHFCLNFIQKAKILQTWI